MITKSIWFCTSPKTKPVNKLKHFPINIIYFPFPHFQVHCNSSHWLYTKIYDSASLLAPLPEMVWLLSSVIEIRALQTFQEGLPFKEGSCKMLPWSCLLKRPCPFISWSEVPMLLHLALLCNSPLSTVFVTALAKQVLGKHWAGMLHSPPLALFSPSSGKCCKMTHHLPLLTGCCQNRKIFCPGTLPAQKPLLSLASER